MSSQQPPRLRAVIDHAGVLSVTGLPQRVDDLCADHDEPDNAYAELVNLCLDTAEQIGGPVWLHATTPTGIWGMAIHVDGMTVPLPLEVFDTPNPSPDDAELAGLADALATAGALAPPPADIVLALAADPAPGIRAAATAELATWGDDPDTVVNADLDPTQLAALADSRLDWIRAGVAAHPAADPITLQQLAADPDPLVVQALARRLDLPAELATSLIDHPEPLVRAELGRNPTTAFLRTPLADHEQGGKAAVAVLAAPATAARPLTDAAPAPQPSSSGRPQPAGAAASSTGPSTSQHGTVRRSSGRRGRWIGGLTVAGLLAVGATATSALNGEPNEPPVTPASAASGAAVPWQGTWLPTGPGGPTDPAAAVATGFAHTPAGAAMAAAHLSVRIDAYAGPASFQPTLLHQTYGGDPAALLARTRAAYTRAAKLAGIADGEPIPTSTGRITGWQITGWTAAGPVPVHLLVTAPNGALVDYAITVAWVNGDYQLVDPTTADTFVTTADPDPSGYTPF